MVPPCVHQHGAKPPSGRLAVPPDPHHWTTGTIQRLIIRSCRGKSIVSQVIMSTVDHRGVTLAKTNQGELSIRLSLHPTWASD